MRCWIEKNEDHLFTVGISLFIIIRFRFSVRVYSSFVFYYERRSGLVLDRLFQNQEEPF